MTTLITGGTGKTGRRVAHRLTAMGRAVKLGSRSGDVRFDWEDDRHLGARPRRVHQRLRHLRPRPRLPGRGGHRRGVRQDRASTPAPPGSCCCPAAARRARSSPSSGWPSPAPTGPSCAARSSRRTSARRSGSSRSAAGSWSLPGNALEPIVDLEDVADVAAVALTDDGHIGEVYECTGPRLLGFDEAMAEIGRAIGREVAFRPVQPGRVRRRAGRGRPAGRRRGGAGPAVRRHPRRPQQLTGRRRTPGARPRAARLRRVRTAYRRDGSLGCLRHALPDSCQPDPLRPDRRRVLRLRRQRDAGPAVDGRRDVRDRDEPDQRGDREPGLPGGLPRRSGGGGRPAGVGPQPVGGGRGGAGRGDPASSPSPSTSRSTTRSPTAAPAPRSRTPGCCGTSCAP